MGRRRITRMRRWLLGSVSNQVIQQLTDPHVTLVG
jgi:nucleotide-binding universal stress UspA family protein